MVGEGGVFEGDGGDFCAEEAGEEGEERTDVFTIRLWQEVPADEVAESETTLSASEG